MGCFPCFVRKGNCQMRNAAFKSSYFPLAQSKAVSKPPENHPRVHSNHWQVFRKQYPRSIQTRAGIWRRQTQFAVIRQNLPNCGEAVSQKVPNIGSRCRAL